MTRVSDRKLFISCGLIAFSATLLVLALAFGLSLRLDLAQAELSQLRDEVSQLRERRQGLAEEVARNSQVVDRMERAVTSHLAGLVERLAQLKEHQCPQTQSR